MSEIDSPIGSRRENIDEDIDVELLISEVKKRPILYTKSPGEYIDRETKQKLWSEVCQALFMPWNDYNLKKKKEKVREVQNKWRNLKDTFAKQYATQNELTPCGRKKRKYYYFDSLSFLIPTMTACEVNVRMDNNNEPEPDIPMDNPSQKNQEDVDIPSASSKTISNVEETWSFPQNIPQDREPILELPKVDDIDENTHFSLMLVPMMRKFNDEQRYYARTEILRIMRQISIMGQEKITLCNTDLLKYPEGEEGSALHNEMTEERTAGSHDDHNYPAVEGMATKLPEEIQYPETDTEDFDV